MKAVEIESIVERCAWRLWMGHGRQQPTSQDVMREADERARVRVGRQQY
jgi:hypothetical protein